MQNLLSELKELLQQDERFIVEGKLLKNSIIEYGLKLDPTLLKLLLSHQNIKRHFFQEVEGIFVFDKIKFQRFVNNKAFLEDSYTSFKNKIGLITHNSDGLYDEFISENKEIILSWPYKDCLLEGGQTKENDKREEIFWNEVLAPDEIDRLLSPKVLTNFFRYDAKGESEVIDISLSDSFLIKGNNLLALHSLKKPYRGKIKLIYIDPPYNTGSNADTFAYNNDFKRSSWLSFMKNRLDVAKELLSKDGVLIVAIDDNEHSHLGVLLKEMFNEYDVHCVTIVHNPRGVQGTNFSYTHEYAYFVLPKGKKSIGDRKIKNEDVEWSNLRNWGSESERTDAKNCFYPIIIDSTNSEIVAFGDVCKDEYHPSGINIDKGNLIEVYPIDKNGIERKWRYARQTVEEIKHLLKARKKSGVWDIEIGKDFGLYKTVWTDTRYDANEYGTKILKDLVPNNPFKFPKSLYTVYDCLYAVVENDKNAIVLDFFGGSGTTAHALLELNKTDNGNRKFILCEQMDYVETVTSERIKKVIKNNNQGSFIYCELAKANEVFLENIISAKTSPEVKQVWNELKGKAFISYQADLKIIEDKISDFDQLNLEEQKKCLIEILDKNLLYFLYSEIDDESYGISIEVKSLNHKFYNLV